MDRRFQRTALLFGEEALHRLNRSRVAVVGLGAVGSFCLEALARSGVGAFRLADFDTIRLTNMNRQLLALSSTIGEAKVDVARRRVLDINPNADVIILSKFMDAAAMDELLEAPVDAVVDAIDSCAPKIELLRQCVQRGIPVYSAMGAAARTDTSKIRVSDISKTAACPLARRIRKALRRQGIDTGVTVVYSVENAAHEVFDPVEAHVEEDGPEFRRGRVRRVIPSSVVVPGIVGLTLAQEVIKALIAAGEGPPPASLQK